MKRREIEDAQSKGENKLDIDCWLHPDLSDSLNPIVKMVDPSYFPLNWSSETYTLKGVDDQLLQEIERNKVWLGISQLTVIYDANAFDETRLSIRFPNVDSFKSLETLTAEIEASLAAASNSIGHDGVNSETDVDEEGDDE